MILTLLFDSHLHPDKAVQPQNANKVEYRGAETRLVAAAQALQNPKQLSNSHQLLATAAKTELQT